MDLAAFRQELTTSISQILSSRTLINYRSQLNAKRLGARISVNLDEVEIWTSLTSLISHSSVLARINHSDDDILIIDAYKYAAQYLEYLSSVSTELDKEYLKIISAFCYDIAGYQANAQCIIRQISIYELTTEVDEEFCGHSNSLSTTNKLLTVIRLFLEKRIGAIEGVQFEQRSSWKNKLSNSLRALTQNILKGEPTDFFAKLEDSYVDSFNTGDYISNLMISLLLVRAQKYSARSIWTNILTGERSTSVIWQRYLRLKANHTYENGKLVPVQNRVSRFELWESQLAAIRSGILESNESFVVQMPTSAGKTFICELVILDAITRNFGSKCLYISPFKALSNQIEHELRRNFFGVGIRASTLSGGFDLDPFDDVIMSDTDVLIATPEKTDLLIRTKPDFFNNLSAIIVDEGHIVAEKSRGSTLELLLARLKARYPNLRIIFVSAVMPEANGAEIAAWLSSGGSGHLIKAPVSSDGRSWQPTSKIFSIFHWDDSTGVFIFPEVEVGRKPNGEIEFAFARGLVTRKQIKTYTKKRRDERIKLFPQKTTDKGETAAAVGLDMASRGPTLIFTTRPDWARSIGNKITDLIDGLEANGQVTDPIFVVNESLESAKAAREWFGEDSIEFKMTRRGIGLHHGKLPDAVRIAVESDYTSGRIKLLVATSSVAQGVNFPVKYLVVHSLVIETREDDIETLSKRDFLNLIGRAGRAGKETEGQIIFVATKQYDISVFSEYVKPNSTEDVKSIYFQILKDLIEQRISEEEFEEKIRTLSEPSVLSMLVEEVVGTTDEERVEKLIDSSLFKLQIQGDSLLQGHFDKIKTKFSDIRTRFGGLTIPENQKTAFGKTGLSIDSNSKILGWIDGNKDDLSGYIQATDYLSILSFAVSHLFSDELPEMKYRGFERIAALSVQNVRDLIEAWISGESIENLISLFRSFDEEITTQDFHLLLGEGFSFRFPWLMNSFFEIYRATVADNEFQEDLQFASTFLKYGVNSKAASFFAALGLSSRRLAIRTAALVGEMEPSDLIKWLTEISEEDLQREGFSPSEIADLMDLATKHSSSMGTLSEYVFQIKGASYIDSRKQASRNVNVGDHLLLARDFENMFDPYAIKVFADNIELGFVPKELARKLSPEIDVFESSFVCKVTDKTPFYDWFKLSVSLSRN